MAEKPVYHGVGVHGRNPGSSPKVPRAVTHPSALLASADAFFTLSKGYHGLDSLFPLLAFMALARLKTIESLRYGTPGEWGPPRKCPRSGQS